MIIMKAEKETTTTTRDGNGSSLEAFARLFSVSLWQSLARPPARLRHSNGSFKSAPLALRKAASIIRNDNAGASSSTAADCKAAAVQAKARLRRIARVEMENPLT